MTSLHLAPTSSFGFGITAFRSELNKRGVPYATDADKDVDEQIRHARKSILDR